MREKIPQNTLGCKRKDKKRFKGHTLKTWRDIDIIDDIRIRDFRKNEG
jgi:hypothetical protein